MAPITEIGAMIDVSRMCAIAALKREESRGAILEMISLRPIKDIGGKEQRYSMGEDGEMNIDFVSYPSRFRKI